MGFRQFQGRLGSVSGHAILSECWHAVHCTRQGELPASDLFVGFPIPAAKAVFMTTLRFWCSNVIWTRERWRCVLDQARAGSRQGRECRGAVDDNNSPQAMWVFSSGVWHLRSVRRANSSCRVVQRTATGSNLPEASGRRAVRRIWVSKRRSTNWFSAPAPLATSNTPTKVCTSNKNGKS